MRLKLQIDELALDGVHLSRWQRELLGPAIERELRRLTSAASGPVGAPRPHAGGDVLVERIAGSVAAGVHRSLPPVARR